MEGVFWTQLVRGYVQQVMGRSMSCRRTARVMMTWVIERVGGDLQFVTRTLSNNLAGALKRLPGNGLVPTVLPTAQSRSGVLSLSEPRPATGTTLVVTVLYFGADAWLTFGDSVQCFVFVCAWSPRGDLEPLCFVVLEVCGGAGGISQACGRRGRPITCGPVI